MVIDILATASETIYDCIDLFIMEYSISSPEGLNIFPLIRFLYFAVIFIKTDIPNTVRP